MILSLVFIFAVRFSFIRLEISNRVNLFLYNFYWHIRFLLSISFKKKFVKNWKLTHQRKKNLLNLAIFNENKHKYTETFVRNHFENLRFNKVFYYGLPPQFIHPWGDIVSDNHLWKQFKLAFLKLLEIDEKTYFSNRLRKSLKKKKIEIALAEFGTMGVYVYKACMQNSIPLVVIFHGYDAWHQDVVDKNKKEYVKMFSYASKIIGVSRDICSQLERLGCPKQKIVHLPSTINFKIFDFKIADRNLNRILSVGRFAETKSPHLTILAFHEVLKEIPDATLVMVGKDGGGELFEACHILVKALKIEEKVEFKGVLSPDEVKNEMVRASVFVQHSITTPINNDKEGTPVSVMEAMACGLPVVATRHAGIAELINSGENGYLIEEYDYLSMAKQIVFCLKNPELMNEIGCKSSLSISRNKLIANNDSLLTQLLNEIVNLEK